MNNKKTNATGSDDGRLERENMNTVKLQGIYERKTAIPAAELKPGMVTIWNFEFTETVKSVVPTKSGKSVKCVIISDESGKEYTRTMRKDRLVAVAI